MIANTNEMLYSVNTEEIDWVSDFFILSLALIQKCNFNFLFVFRNKCSLFRCYIAIYNNLDKNRH